MNIDIKWESTDLRPQYSKVTILLTPENKDGTIGTITFDGPEISSSASSSLCGPRVTILPIKDGLILDVFEFRREEYPDKPFVKGMFVIMDRTLNTMTGELIIKEGGIETIKKDITFTQIS